MVRMVILLVVAVVLAGCFVAVESEGAVASSVDAPALAVENYLTAKVSNDADGIRRTLCSAMEADYDREVQSFSGVEAEIEGMACASDEGGATVTCEGTIVAVYGGENRDFPLGMYSVVEEDGEWKWCGEAG